MRCTATVQRDFTIQIRSSTDTSKQCLRPAVREFTNGEALCLQHLTERYRQHFAVLERIEALSR